jgi:hypothetical protein
MSGHIYEYKGMRYWTVERNAKVGEKVLIIHGSYTFGMYKDGDVLTVDDVGGNGVYVQKAAANGNGNGFIDNDEYLVLEPLESEEVTVDTSQASPQVIEMFTALSRKIVSLESQLRDTQGNVENLAEEIAQTRHSGHNNLLDIREIYGRLKETEDKVEMALDDIVTLDSRTQVVNAITKFYEEGRR